MGNTIARVAVLRRKARCFVCLQSNHVARKYPSEYKCNKCENRHHILICNQSIQKTANTHISSDQKSILLQTGRAYVFHSEEPGGSGLVRVLFDDGSQRSYVNEYLAEKLNLSVVCQLAISSFGAKFLMQSGGFVLRKWCTNDEILQRMINEEERVTDIDMNYEHKSEKPQPQETPTRRKYFKRFIIIL